MKDLKDQLIEKLKELIIDEINNAYQRGYEDRDFDIGYGSNRIVCIEQVKIKIASLEKQIEEEKTGVVCLACGEPISQYCERCKHLLES